MVSIIRNANGGAESEVSKETSSLHHKESNFEVAYCEPREAINIDPDFVMPIQNKVIGMNFENCLRDIDRDFAFNIDDIGKSCGVSI